MSIICYFDVLYLRRFCIVFAVGGRSISSFGIRSQNGTSGSLLFVFRVQLKVFWKESSTLLGGLFGDFGIVLLLMLISRLDRSFLRILSLPPFFGVIRLNFCLGTEINENHEGCNLLVDFVDSKGFFEDRFVEVLANEGILRGSLEDREILNDFALWQVRMKALLEQQGLAAALEESPAATILVGELAAVDTAISDKDQTLLLLTSLPSSYDNFKMTEAKGDGGEGFYVRGRSGQRDMEQGTYSAWSKSQGRSSRLGCYICQSEEHLKRDCPRYNHKKSQGCVRIEDHVSGSGADGYDTVNVMMAMNGMPCTRDIGFTVKMQLGKIKVIKGSLVVLSGTRRANCVYTLDGQEVTKKTLKGRKQLGEYQIGWKIKTGNVLDFCNQRSPSSAIRFKTPIDMLGLFGWLASKRQGMLEPVKVKCIFLGCRKGVVGNKALECCKKKLSLRCKAEILATKGLLDKAKENILATYMTLTEAPKEAIWLKGLAIESGFELKIVAGIATRALSKAVPRSRLHLELKLLRIKDF
ncbi:zinc finger, CCHC-type containing protein [Tanacetum coccineum]